MSWSSNSKCCATCAHWAGERKPSGCGFAQTNSPSDRAKCWEGVFCGVTQGPSAMSGASCSKYQKWSALK